MDESEIPFGVLTRRAALGAEIHAAFANRAHSGLQSILQASAEAVVHHLGRSVRTHLDVERPGKPAGVAG